MAKSDRKIIDKVFVLLGVVAIAVMLVVSGISWYAANFAKDNVRTELSAQKVYFPEKGSPALTSLPAEDRKEVEKYAGQQLTTGNQAKVYANHFIAVHLNKVAGGLTYSQVSAKAQSDPTNIKLQQQKTVLFQGETLRGLLLGDGYAYWTFGQIAEYVALASLVGAAAMTVLVLLGLRHMARVR